MYIISIITSRTCAGHCQRHITWQTVQLMAVNFYAVEPSPVLLTSGVMAKQELQPHKCYLILGGTTVYLYYPALIEQSITLIVQSLQYYG